MSQRLISRSSDLKRLRDEGYAVSIRAGHLVLDRIPYVDAKKRVGYGALVSELTLAGDVTAKPSTHVVHFSGDYPCNQSGDPIERIRSQSDARAISDGLTVHHSFSSKPAAGYLDYYDKMTTYARILSTPAAILDPSASPTPFPAIPDDAEDSVFSYVDTASSRAGVTDLSAKLETERVGIVGLGGTGSYVLDFVAKTPAREIHLFDGDPFSQHNAFRAPGAPSIEELQQRPKKVKYLSEQYSRMRRGIVAHDCFLCPANLHLLEGLTFVFLCLGDGEAKRPIVKSMEAKGTPFVDVGMGLVRAEDESLLGILRVTTSTRECRQHVYEKHRIPFADAGQADEYATNIQVAELNALNAALAVVKWKKLRGIYLDLDREHFCTYTIDGNTIANEDKLCQAPMP